ncbi:hypothetical protein EVAR_31236_1 [Eumeta japonica]|uniref:Mariner Mos1 transposase n=1 Tax=Eumeta variegata TaxID=151549 RepID=A0A4C1VZS8_EUMVA|nr:hypothetical protein EVAR_31236_1 [Eumeta japonica]
MWLRWIQHKAETEAQKKRTALLGAMQCLPNLAWNIVTGEKIWMYCYDFKIKQQFLIKLDRWLLLRENCRTVNSDWYMTLYLPESIDEFHKNNRQRRIIFHHDKVSSRTAKQTHKLLKKKKVELMSNPATAI